MGINDEHVDSVHRAMVLAINVVRTFLCVTLVYSGTVFLTEDTDYLNLIFDALSLVFIIQVDELLYSTLLKKQMKHEHQGQPPVRMKRAKHLFCWSRMATEIIRVLCL